MSNIGAWFKKMRDLRGETIEEQAKTLGFPTSAISHYSAGRRCLSKKMIARIIRGYDLDENAERDLLLHTLENKDVETAKYIKENAVSMSVLDIAVACKFGVYDD